MNKKSTKPLKAKDPVKQLLDENNTENIVLFDDNNKPIEFEQIAIIPLEETNKLYAILIPITPMQGVAEGEGVLFEIFEQSGDLKIVNDQKIIDEVLTIYKELIDDNDEGKSN